MVHTAELTYFPSSELMRSFTAAETGTQWYKQDGTWVNDTLRKNGLVVMLRSLHRQGYTSLRMICRVNFLKLLNPNEKVNVMTAWDIDAVEEQFNQLIKMICPEIPDLQYWKVNRIDYCVNVKTPYVEEYIKLMKKGDRRYLRDWYDGNHNYTQKPGSLYLVSTAKHKKNRSATVNFYNKQDEIMKSLGLKDDGWDLQEDEDYLRKLMDVEPILELAADTLRLEVQCHRAKTDNLKQSLGFPGKYVQYYLNPHIAEDIISKYIHRIAGIADYSRRSVALDQVDQTRHTTATKEKMKKIIMDVAVQRSSVAKVRDKYLDEKVMTRDEFSHLIRMMQEDNINPVTISDNVKLKGKTGKEGLPSVLSIFEDAFENEMVKDGE